MKVELDKERQLGFTLGAMKRAKKLGVLALDTSNPEAMMLALPELVWCCLDGEGRGELSVADIDEIVTPRNAQGIAGQVIELFRLSMPDDKPGNAEPAAATEPTAGERSTSTRSGQSGSTTWDSVTANSGG